MVCGWLPFSVASPLKSNGGTHAKWNYAGAVRGTRTYTRSHVHTPCDPAHPWPRCTDSPGSVLGPSSRTGTPAATVVTTRMQRYPTCPHMSAPDLNRRQMSTRTGKVRSHHGLSVYAAIVRDALSQGVRYPIHRDSSNTRMVRRSGNIAVSRRLAQSGHRVYCLTCWYVMWVP